MLMPISLDDLDLVDASELGGKAFNTWRLLKADTASLGIAVPDSVVVPILSNSVGQVRFRSSAPNFPLIVRSSSAKEDQGNSSFSGLLTSVKVTSMPELRQALENLAAEATRMDAHPVSALIQPLLSFTTGFTVGIFGSNSVPRTARVEHAAKVVPVESAPDGWLMFEYRTSPEDTGGRRWHLEDERNSLAATNDVVSVARLLLELCELDWPECREPSWYMEIEAGVTISGVVWCLQTRFDLVQVPAWATRPKVLVGFGSDRNFPAPVSRLTASVLGPVLSRQFGAPIVLDENADVLVCRSTTAPPAVFRENCIASVRSDGRFDISVVEEVADTLNCIWVSARQLYTRWLDDASLGAAVEILTECQAIMMAYFESGWFRRAVGTELLGPGLSEDAKIAFYNSDHRSRLALELSRDAMLLRDNQTRIRYVQVLLFGDDALGQPRLVEALGFSAAQVREYIATFFSRECLVDNQIVEGLWTNFGSLNTEQRSLCVSLWAQDFDNQVKDAAYYSANLALKTIGDILGTDIGTLQHLSIGEIVEACGQPARAEQLLLTAALRRGSLRLPLVDVGAIGSDDEVSEVSVSLDNGWTRNSQILEFVKISGVSQIAEDDEPGRSHRVYIVSAVSPLEAITLPTVHGLWLYDLGEMAHAAHLLRSRTDIGFLVMGHSEVVGVDGGLYRCHVDEGLLKRSRLKGIE